MAEGVGKPGKVGKGEDEDRAGFPPERWVGAHQRLAGRDEGNEAQCLGEGIKECGLGDGNRAEAEEDPAVGLDEAEQEEGEEEGGWGAEADPPSARRLHGEGEKDDGTKRPQAFCCDDRRDGHHHGDGGYPLAGALGHGRQFEGEGGVGKACGEGAPPLVALCKEAEDQAGGQAEGEHQGGGDPDG